MKRRSSNRAWRHSTSSTKTGRDPSGPGSGPSPLAVPVASSRAWEGKAVPVLRARLCSAVMPIRPRLVPSGQRTSMFGKSHRKRAHRHVKSGRLCLGYQDCDGTSILVSLERDELWFDRHPAPTFCLSMISSENRIPPIGSKPEGKLFRIMLWRDGQKRRNTKP
jgi:hypothetical protein